VNGSGAVFVRASQKLGNWLFLISIWNANPATTLNNSHAIIRYFSNGCSICAQDYRNFQVFSFFEKYLVLLRLQPAGGMACEFSNQPASTSLKMLVRTVKSRWWIEHSCKELKDELGLDHFEGRSWRGWHHHVVLVLLAYAFLQGLRRRPSKKDCPADAASTSRRTTMSVDLLVRPLLAGGCGQIPSPTGICHRD